MNEAPAVTETAALFRALGDRQRLRILQHLLSGEHRVVDLTSHLGLAQSTVSKHLACLRDCGLVESQAVGRSSVFTLSQPAMVTALLGSAQTLLRATGDAVTSCSTYDEVSA